jgi:hypothetical protein
MMLMMMWKSRMQRLEDNLMEVRLPSLLSVFKAVVELLSNLGTH